MKINGLPTITELLSVLSENGGLLFYNIHVTVETTPLRPEWFLLNSCYFCSLM